MGPSGCGKSTLLNLVAGLDVPDEGEIVLAGESLVGKNENELAIMRRQHIGHRVPVLQPARGHDRARERHAAGGDRRRASARSPRRGPATCSTCSASATRRRRRPACSPAGSASASRSPGRSPTSRRSLLADEPTGALDSEGGEEVLELFRRLHAGGQTILLVTHDEPVADAADRIVRMQDGRVVDDGLG